MIGRISSGCGCGCGCEYVGECENVSVSVSEIVAEAGTEAETEIETEIEIQTEISMTACGGLVSGWALLLWVPVVHDEPQDARRHSGRYSFAVWSTGRPARPAPGPGIQTEI